jgi:hypothetical protein
LAWILIVAAKLLGLGDTFMVVIVGKTIKGHVHHDKDAYEQQGLLE